jgi:hypothetical protein
MSDKEENTESNTNRISGTLGDNATNSVLGNDNLQIYINQSGQDKTIDIDALSVEEKELLKACYMNVIIAVYHVGESIPLIYVGPQNFPTEMRYKRSLKRLREYGLIRLIKDKTETYELTGIGDAIAETLN